MRKQCIVIVMIAFLLLALGTLITAFFLDYESYENDVVLGKVRVGTELYYEKDGETYPGAEVVIDPANNIKKKGIYHINVVDRESVEFIENVRIRVVVESDVDTYIRIKLLDQMVLTTVNYLGDRTEVPIIAERTEFYYDESEWYYNDDDDYYYYKLRAKRVSESEPLTIVFIGGYFPDIHYHTRPLGYSIQMGIKTEAVQAHRGPQQNWGLDNPPWGGTW